MGNQGPAWGAEGDRCVSCGVSGFLPLPRAPLSQPRGLREWGGYLLLGFRTFWIFRAVVCTSRTRGYLWAWRSLGRKLAESRVWVVPAEVQPEVGSAGVSPSSSTPHCYWLVPRPVKFRFCSQTLVLALCPFSVTSQSSYGSDWGAMHSLGQLPAGTL